MDGRAIFVVLVLVAGFSAPVMAQEDSVETLLEQRKALEADRGLKPTVTTLQVSGDPEGTIGNQPYLFVAVDEITEYANAVDIGDNAFTQLFTGYDPWGAAIIPAATPGDAVVFFVSGTELWRWQSGAPVLCCNMTYQGANQSMVSVAYNPSAEQLLMTKNTTTEAVYSLLVPGGVCPVSCEVIQAIVYSSADNDFGGLAFDFNNGFLYGTNDDATPGPAGVYRILPDGTTSLAVAYPAGETDIDGLAYGDGKLYLVTDQPGSIYVYDIAGAAFDPPLTNPWTTSELFSAGAYGAGLIPVELQSLTIE